MTEYHDSRQARHEVASYLAYYNQERRHSFLDYLNPAAFEAQTQPVQIKQLDCLKFAKQLRERARSGREPE